MPSNVINLSAELEAREDERALTPKQEITVELRNHYNEQTRLMKALRFHKVAHKARMREYIKLTERIELQEKRLMEV
jgi:hypothetical protein